MAKVKVVCYKRRKKIHEEDSEELYYLRQQARDSKVYTIRRIARDIEAHGALSAEDVEHATASLIRQIRKTLRDGNRVKLDGLGTFFLSFSCQGANTPEECSIRDIGKIHICFEEDKTKHFVNASHNPVKDDAGNIEFEVIRK